MKLSKQARDHRHQEEQREHQQRRRQEEPGRARLGALHRGAHGASLPAAACSRSQRRLARMRCASASRAASASSTVAAPRMAASARRQTWSAICSHSGTAGVGDHVLELPAEGEGARVVGEAGVVPGGAVGRQVAGEAEETHLLRRLAEELDQAPGGVLLVAAAKDDQARTAGERDARHAGRGAGQRRGGPVVLLLGGQAAAELAEVPGAGDVHREGAARELLVEVGDLVVADRRGEAVAEEVDVVGEGAAVLRRREGAAGAAVGEQRRAGLQAQDGRLRPLVHGQQDAVGARRRPCGRRRSSRARQSSQVAGGSAWPAAASRSRR